MSKNLGNDVLGRAPEPNPNLEPNPNPNATLIDVPGGRLHLLRGSPNGVNPPRLAHLQTTDTASVSVTLLIQRESSWSGHPPLYVSIYVYTSNNLAHSPLHRSPISRPVSSFRNWAQLGRCLRRGLWGANEAPTAAAATAWTHEWLRSLTDGSEKRCVPSERQYGGGIQHG